MAEYDRYHELQRQSSEVFDVVGTLETYLGQNTPGIYETGVSSYLGKSDSCWYIVDPSFEEMRYSASLHDVLMLRGLRRAVADEEY